MVYIFIYNVIYIKSNFSRIRKELGNPQMILIGSPYCLRHLENKNRYNFDNIHQISRDFHTVDYKEIEEIVLLYIKKYGSNNIRLLTNEDSTQIVCAQLREKYGILGHSVDMVLPFVNKLISKERLENTVKIPRFIKFNKDEYAEKKDEYLKTIINYIQFPMFAKPIDLVSSVETHYIPDRTSLKEISDMILSHSYEFEIDEFISGDLYHCDAMIIDGDVKFFMVGKCSFALARFFEGKPVGSIPINDSKLFSKLQEFCERVFKKLNCYSGAYHMEAFLDNNTQEFVFLEIAARTGGALISKVYEKLFEINIEEVHYLIQLNLIQEVKVKKKDIYAGFLNYPTIKGKVLGIKSPVIDINHEFIKFVKPGENLEQASNLLDISCSSIFWDSSYEKVEHTFEFLKNYQPLLQK